MLSRLLSSVYSWIAMVTIVIIVITANSFYVVNTLNTQSTLEAKLFTTNRIINAANDLHASILRVESAQRGYMLTGEKALLEGYTDTLNQINETIDEVEIAAQNSDTEQQSVLINEMLLIARAHLNHLIESVETQLEGTPAEANTIADTIALYSEFEAVFDDVKNAEREIQGRHLAALMALRDNSIKTLLVSSGSAIFLIIVIFVLLKTNERSSYENQQKLSRLNIELEKKIAERTQELQLYSEELVRSNRELEDFAFVASHDLQEPLRKIRAFGDRLRSGYQEALDERGQDFLQRMLNASARMSMLITDLLAFSRVSTRGKDFERVALSEVVDSVVDDLEVAIEESGATLDISKLPVVNADKSQMDQLFLNLLSNALKFRQADTAPHIVVNASEPSSEEIEGFLLSDDYQWVKLTISDNGIGFDQSFADKVFAPFQRLHGRSEYQGTGIGLAVCRRIVERHNGQIQARSTPGEGATFTIIMPSNGELFSNQGQEGITTNGN
ncbi:sensor histidine kinase [Alteromonas halophila]|uniref:histidine kinase n=1 Tax=Alteromonas halophila TaxID=516698 RepID=A0A918JME6_9ALTE|nr:ATP-binding protein [Alteromonas halophila]GGW89915.1 hypothetical protein GCM10007391_25310 [Alteromonas halophila]